ncbi:MAG: GIY-YIG nuclease family protein, partial [Cyanobacteria bacterium J06559_3]
KFVITMDRESIQLRVQKSLTIAAICAWLKTWTTPGTQLTTPGGRTHSLDGEKVGNQTNFIYFVFNADSHAIKIGRAKNVSRRLQSLQTASPAPLKLLKTISIDGLEAAKALEESLHQQFQELRLYGEWFRADTVLMKYTDET